MKPDIRRVDSLLHISYANAGRVHTAKSYPLTAPNGSTIILIGCETGLQILWRGGQPVKGQARNSLWKDDGILNHQENGDEVDSVTHDHSVHFEENEDEGYTPSTEFMPIIQSINLPLSTAVLHIAVPHIPRNTSKYDHDSIPKLYSDYLVVAAACSDCSVRLITIPLAPPSSRIQSEAKPARTASFDQMGPYGERVLVILGGTNHQSIPKCLSLTLVPSSTGHDSDLEMDEDDTQCVLLIHRLPLNSDGTGLDLIADGHNVPWITQVLPSSPVSLHFHPSLPGDGKNCRLLVAERKGTVRILGCSTAENVEQFSSLLSLYPGIQSSRSGRGARKHVLDAQWVLDGNAVLVLLEDGEWGIWDLRGQGPKAEPKTLATQIPTLGSFYTFAIKGRVNGESNTSKVNDAAMQRKEGSKTITLAPTTPSTRRMRQENLFSGPLHPAEGAERGGISIISSQNHKAVDEAVLLWHNDGVIVIRSLRTHWASKVKGCGNLFGNGDKGEARIVNNVSLNGERRTDVALLPANSQSNSEGPFDHAVLVTGESRFVLVTSPSNGQGTSSGSQLSPRLDQRMLEHGELDLDGMDRVLSTLANKTNESTANGVPPKRKVGFVNI
ncbi:MAG: hypothetical protein Q9170_002783 [Blastenia crenularia]